MIKLWLSAPHGRGCRDIFVYLSKHHPFTITTRKGKHNGEDVVFTVIDDGIHNNGGWEALDAMYDVLERIDEALKHD